MNNFIEYSGLYWTNIFLNEYFGFCFELNFELNHFSARFNEKMNFQNVPHTPIWLRAMILRAQLSEKAPRHLESLDKGFDVLDLFSDKADGPLHLPVELQ